MTSHHVWTKEELRLLKQLVKEQLPWKIIALQIGTVNARQARGRAELEGWHRVHVRTERISFTVKLPAPLYREWSRLVNKTGHNKARRIGIILKEDVNRMLRKSRSP